MKIAVAFRPHLSATSLFEGAVRLVATVFALAALLLAGFWLTQITAPRPVARLPAADMAQSQNHPVRISQLFGVTQVSPQVTEGLLLTGVFAVSRGGGFATFYTRGGALSAFPGDEVAPGVKLEQIQGDRVLLQVAGVQKELRLTSENVPVASADSRVMPEQARPVSEANQEVEE